MSGVHISSEIGSLLRVVVHEPGQEIENVTPSGAAEALYDDIMFLQPALLEHRQMTAVLRRCSEVFELIDLLTDVLGDAAVRSSLVDDLCAMAGCRERAGELVELEPRHLAHQLIEGTPMRKDSLAKHLDPRRFDLPPLSNMFFTRDAAMVVGGCAVIGAMASDVRRAEARIMKTLFTEHPQLKAPICFDGTAVFETHSLEGGDVQVLRSDLVVIGLSERTSVKGIDHLVGALARRGEVQEVIVVILPHGRATIHLDMVFTVIDDDLCVVHAPLMLGERRCPAIQLTLGPVGVRRIRDQDGLLDALDALGMPLKALPCGGDDPVRQEREQWSSGANFFTFAPGKVIGYGRNEATFDVLAREGFEIVQADDIAVGRVDPLRPGRLAVAMAGAESSRGGGGCRCMTLPIAREAVGATSVTHEIEEGA